MINLLEEDPISLEKARGHRLLRMRDGGPPTFNTITRWVKLGIRGVKLEAVVKPSGLYTTEAAILRFIEHLTMPPGSEKAETPTQRRKSWERADKILKAAGM